MALEERGPAPFDAAGVLVGDPNALPDLEDLRTIVDTVKPRATPKQETSSVAEWQPRIEALLKAGAKPKAIFDCLCREEASGHSSATAPLPEGHSSATAPLPEGTSSQSG